MSTDLRGFDYPLEPVRRRQQWQLDALQARLGHVQRELAAARQRAADLQARHATGSRDLADRLNQRWDGAHHSTSLRWLAQLRSDLAAIDRELADLQACKAELATLCLTAQRRLDALAEHREDLQRDYALDQTRRDAAEADRNWLARLEMQR